MRPIDELKRYLDAVRRRLIFSDLLRGAAMAASVALLTTVVLVFITNYYAFSDTSLTWSRAVLFLVVAFAVAFGMIAPVLVLNSRRAARRAEAAVPEFEQRLVTVVEAEPTPFVNLLARETMDVARVAGPSRVVSQGRLAGFGSAAFGAVMLLAWLILAGPGYFGHGASLLWAGTPKTGAAHF